MEDYEIRRILIAREDDRRACLVASDREGLADLLSDDLVHVHATGQVHGKAQLLDHATGFLQFVSVVRDRLDVRPIAASAAIMTGAMTNVVRRRGDDEQVTVHAFVTQVWVRKDAVWRIASFHAVRLPEKS